MNHKDSEEVSDHEGGDEGYQEGFEKMKRSSDSTYSSFEDNKVVTVAQIQNMAAMHECNICGKSFKNGKALGGHRRSHFQAAKVKPRFSNNHHHLSKTKTSPSITVNNNNNNYNNKLVSGIGSEEDGKHTCYLCKKDFPSNHSLYGHMRSHPERLWRGVCPPPHPLHGSSSSNKQSCSSSSLSSDLEDDFDDDDEDDDFDDDTNVSKITDLPKWKKTGKRGRMSTSVIEAAENLMLLSSRFNHNNNFQIPKSKVSPEYSIPSQRKSIADDSTSSQKRIKIKCYLGDDVSDYYYNKVNRGKGLSEEEDEEEEEEEIRVRDETISVNKYGGMKEKEKKHNDDMLENSESMNFEERKKVKKDKKSKGKKVKKIVLKKAKGQDSELTTEDKSYLCNNINNNNNGYVCDICLKSFATFQGLGGHRSVHNKDKNVMDMAESKPSDVATADDDSTFRGLVMMEAKANEVEIDNRDEQALNQPAPRIKDFDLNMPPDDDMHD